MEYRLIERKSKEQPDYKYTMDQVVHYLIEHQISVTTMESCTSGLLASCITDTEGASAIMKGAFVTYSNEAKVMQGVPAEVIEKYGVYSIETADAMASACRRAYEAELGIGVTGTTGNVDPNNADSVSGEIYCVIQRKCEKRGVKLVMDTAGMSRHEIKERIVREIVEELGDICGIEKDRP